jgi:hypothetical protein
MSDETHSPGPWRWVEGAAYENDYLVDAGGNRVCHLVAAACGGKRQWARKPGSADRALIASAPDLLAQRDRLLALVNDMQDPAWHGTYDGCYLCGGDSGNHSQELRDGVMAPCRIGAILAEPWAVEALARIDAAKGTT